MNFYTDLHIHSKYSRATSKNLTLEELAIWAKKKGLSLIGTGDFTHPAWFEEIKQKLSEASIKGDDIAKQILANTNEKVDLIEKNISRVISAEEKTLSAQMTQKTLDASIELAKQHIKSLLKDNMDLHNKFIDESIDSIDRV